MKKLYLPLIAILMLSECGEKPGPDPVNPQPDKPESGEYSYDLMPSALTALDGGWKAGNELMVIVSGKPTAYALPGSTSAGLATVKGKKSSSSDVYVAYPNGKGIEFLGSALEAAIPASQSGKKVTELSYSAAKMTAPRMQMKDFCARISFSLADNSFTNLKVTASNDVKLAGKVKMTFPSGQDSSLKATGESGTITLYPGESGLFAAGEYALVCLDIPAGTTLRFEANDVTMHYFEATVENCAVETGKSKDLGTLKFKEMEVAPPTKDIDRDEIPDFSRVGYHYGDKEIPDVAVQITLEAPKDGADATELIQNAINTVKTPGCILLKNGTYNVGGELKVERDGVVIRGESAKAIIHSTAKTQQAALITIGRASTYSVSTYSRITDSYTPCGSMFVKVANPESFKPGDVVFVYRQATAKWISDLNMDKIPERADGGKVSQWTASGFNLYWERIVTEVKDGCVYLDNPIVMGIGGEGYGEGRLYHGYHDRVSECGIENITLTSQYDASIKSGSDFTDEDHCWHAVRFLAAKNCWARRVQTRYFGNSGVLFDVGAKLITVDDCHVYDPVSIVTGGRRYAFNMNDCQLCLVKDCTCDNDRHQFVLGSRVAGPNVFLRCTGTRSRAEAGPHHRWSTGTLFDNVKVSTDLNLHDRSNAGSGQGWACANTVIYNCTASRIVCQNPWVSAHNWAIGCIGENRNTAINYQDNLGPRPDGVWISPGVKVTPDSMYESQLADRHAKGVWLGDL